MKNVLPLILLFLSHTAYSQIKLPKVKNLFKKEVAGLKVNWSCAQENYGQIAQLTESAEVTVSLKEDGTVEYHPDIFKIKPLSKQFFQGINPKKLFNKDKTTYRVDYDDCLDRFYSSIDKAHREYKKDCVQENKLCDYDSRFLIKKSQEAVESSRYFEEKNDVVPIPTILPGNGNISMDGEEALSLLKKFCLEDKAVDTGKLLSQAVGQVFKTGTNGYSTKFPGLACAKKYTDLLNEEVSKTKDEFCHDGGRNPVCDKVELNFGKLQGVVSQAVERIKQVIPKEERSLSYRYKKQASDEAVENHLRNNFKFPENCTYASYTNVDNTSVNLNLYDQAISNNIEKIFEEGSPDCQKQFLQNYVASKAGMLENDKAFKEHCDLHNTDFCTKMLGEKEVVEQNISKMMKLIYGEAGERFYNEQIACEMEPSTPLAGILEKIKDSEKALRCMDIKAGEFMNVSARLSPKAETGDYTLKNLGNKKYEAYFNIDFNNNPEASTSPAELMERVQSCMAEVSPFFKGPNGEQLTIKVMNEDSGLNDLPVNQRPKKTNINIFANPGHKFRSSSREYAETINCPTITHEILHLFGLCDEYRETEMDYGCRVVPDAVSVMKNQHEMFAIAIDKEVTCSCEDRPCKDVMNGNDEEKKKLFLSKTIYEVMSGFQRVDYCSYKDLESQSYDQITEKDKGILLSESSETRLVVEGREFSDRKIGHVSRIRYSCSCPADDLECKKFIAETKKNIISSYDDVRKSCPAGSRFRNETTGDASRSQVSYDPDSKEMKLTQKAKAPSLLHPSHFERILGGACEDKGAKYLECAKYAYRSGKCEVPDYCKEDSEYLGTKQ